MHEKKISNVFHNFKVETRSFKFVKHVSEEQHTNKPPVVLKESELNRIYMNTN